MSIACFAAGEKRHAAGGGGGAGSARAGQPLRPDGAATRAVAFAKIDGLPGAEAQLAVLHEHQQGRAVQGAFDVSVTVAFGMAKAGSCGTRRRKKPSISRQTSGSAPSLMVRPQVVCGQKRASAPLRGPGNCVRASRRRRRTSPVMSCIRQRPWVVMSKASMRPPVPGRGGRRLRERGRMRRKAPETGRGCTVSGGRR